MFSPGIKLSCDPRLVLNINLVASVSFDEKPVSEKRLLLGLWLESKTLFFFRSKGVDSGERAYLGLATPKGSLAAKISLSFDSV
jgi:hypothetical protein